MISYTIYSPISSIMCDFAVLSVFAEFDFASHIIRVKEDVEALRINIARKRGPTQHVQIVPNTTV